MKYGFNAKPNSSFSKFAYGKEISYFLNKMLITVNHQTKF